MIDESDGSVWARPEMSVIFRAEIMPGKNREERTFRIAHVMPNGRVVLHNFNGEYRQTAFEKIDFQRNLSS
ncbi:MAG: hypothetical protein JNL64_04335 [Blastocatellia bacterium]|nr:hypothetical protein [Blastocatellia bacterium]